VGIAEGSVETVLGSAANAADRDAPRQQDAGSLPDTAELARHLARRFAVESETDDLARVSQHVSPTEGRVDLQQLGEPAVRGARSGSVRQRGTEGRANGSVDDASGPSGACPIHLLTRTPIAESVGTHSFVPEAVVLQEASTSVTATSGDSVRRTRMASTRIGSCSGRDQVQLKSLWTAIRALPPPRVLRVVGEVA
jgi:hypothetical protein